MKPSRRRFGRSLKPFKRPWLWAGLWMLAVGCVVVASLLPVPDFDVDLPDDTDKIEHFLAYAALAAGAVQLFATRLSWAATCMWLVLLGIGMEFAQGELTTTRQMDAADALANTLGVLAGLATSLTPWRDALLRFDRRT